MRRWFPGQSIALLLPPSFPPRPTWRLYRTRATRCVVRVSTVCRRSRIRCACLTALAVRSQRHHVLRHRDCWCESHLCEDEDEVCGGIQQFRFGMRVVPPSSAPVACHKHRDIGAEQGRFRLFLLRVSTNLTARRALRPLRVLSFTDIFSQNSGRGYCASRQ